MLLQMSLGGSLLILAGGLLRLGFGKKIPAGAFFSLWRLAILRLLLPLSIPIPWGSVQRAEPPGVLHIPSTAPGDAGVVFPAEPVLETAVSPGRAASTAARGDFPVTSTCRISYLLRQKGTNVREISPASETTPSYNPFSPSSSKPRPSGQPGQAQRVRPIRRGSVRLWMWPRAR